MIVNIEIHENHVHMLLNEYVISLKRIIFWNGMSATYLEGRAGEDECKP
jgi:REP element-mobilizing transposase RayT